MHATNIATAAGQPRRVRSASNVELSFTAAGPQYEQISLTFDYGAALQVAHLSTELGFTRVRHFKLAEVGFTPLAHYTAQPGQARVAGRGDPRLPQQH
jgi:hypothetical protein